MVNAMDAALEVKSKLDIADIVGEYLQLKPAGSGSFKSNCPFHQEKTPSFYVNRPRQSWHCFGCNQGGDVISFVMQMEGMEFSEALALLAQKAGVTLPVYDIKTSSIKKRIQEINAIAAKYFQSILHTSPAAEHARAYIKRRGLDDLTTDIWQIGYALDGWNNLTDALKQKTITEDEMLQAGLVIKNEKGSVYDRFRGRVMFAICDAHGNVVGFTGRILTEDKEVAKYVNTPETLVYKKSAILFGLDKAKGDIKRQDLAVIAEGNMDVISSHQFNIENVVCSSGTALTEEQLHLLKRFTVHLAIAFDADAAGNAATIRGLDLARKMDFDIKIISLPAEAGKDPDEAIRKDPALWRQAIHDALPVIEWLYRNAFRQEDISKPEGKKSVAKKLLPEFARISDAVERDAWVNRLAKDLSVSPDALREAMRPTGAVTRHPAHRDIQPATPSMQVEKPREQELMERVWAVLYLKPELVPLAVELCSAYHLDQSPPDDLLNYIAALADREFQDQSLDVLRRELEQTLHLLHVQLNMQELARLEQDMRDAERVGDEPRIQELASRFANLSRS